MAQRLPLAPSIPFYRVGTSLGGTQVILDVRWNSREEAWYVDMLREDETPIRYGMKIVLGVIIGGREVNEDFPPGLLAAVDTSGQNKDAGFDDLGEDSRVVVNFWPWAELA